MAETIAKKYLESLPRPKGWRQRRKWPWVLAAAVVLVLASVAAQWVRDLNRTVSHMTDEMMTIQNTVSDAVEQQVNAALQQVTSLVESFVYGDNVFEKDGIRRDRTGDGEKTRCLCGKRGIFNWDGPAMGPQIIRQLERRASRRSASFFHALASPGRPRNGGGASGAYQPAEGRKTLIQGRFRAQEGPLGPSRKSQQQTKRTGFAALEDSIADEAPEGKQAKRANRALNRAGINSRGQKQGFGGADRLGGRVTSR